MGLDASVMCRCWVDGKTTRPPHADHVRIDGEGYLTLDLPWREHQTEHDEFETWLAAACPHRDMEYAGEHVGNWSSYRAFQQSLGKLGWERFPVLHRELPNANGGSMSSLSAAEALRELAALESASAKVASFYLTDADTGEELYEYIEAYGGIFVWSGTSGINIGVDPNGLFIVDPSEPPRELFRAMLVEQRLLEPELTERHSGGRVEFRNVETGEAFTCTTAVSGNPIAWPDGRMQDDKGRIRCAYPRRLAVRSRLVGLAEDSSSAYVIGALTRIFRASVETNNPVRWC